jgi:opacity protein-like surface antigen
MSVCRKLLAALLLLSALSSPALAGDFIDTRITFALSDDNLLVNAGKTNPSSPLPSFIPGARSTLFFDNYNRRDTGFESLSHIVLYKKMPGFIPRLDTAAGLVVRMDYHLERREFRLRDSGSYIDIQYDLGSNKKLGIRRNIQFTGFPLSSDRFRLGYSFDISWGGDLTFPRRTLKSPVPGAKLQFNYDFDSKSGLTLFLGGKTGLLQQLVTQEQIEEETVYGALAGWGLRLGGFQWQGGAAYFNKGTFFNPSVKGEPVHFYGASTQLSYTHGMPIGVSIDFRLYRNNPNQPILFFKPENYSPGKFSFAVSSEVSYVVNMVEDPERTGGIVPLPGIAADLNFRMKYGYLRLHADVVFRDLGFILVNVPGIVPFQGFSKEQKLSPEFFAAVGADYYFTASRVTIGLKLGVQMPATFQAVLPKEVTGNVAPGALQGETIVVVRDEGDWVFVPVVDSKGNQNVILPVFSAKANFKWQMSKFMAMVGELLFSIDNNTTRLQFKKGQVDGTVVTERVFDFPIQLGFNLMVQASF